MLPEDVIEQLVTHCYRFATGVPDSIFKHLLNTINEDHRFQHVITNNEGESCALAAGYHLATGKIPLVYMQNSGLGNSINPLTSLLDSNIYSIPALLFITWRGMPGEKDEPQHRKMGEILPGMLNLLDIPYSVAADDTKRLDYIFKLAEKHFQQHKKPYAILFPKNIIQAKPGTEKTITLPDNMVIREQLLEKIVSQLSPNDIVVTTTGKTSRELFEIRERRQEGHAQDFLTVGSMGCASSIALGIAMQQPNRRVVLIDGDGACLMRMEAMATIGHIQPKNLLHIVIDNNAYESTGTQKTLSSNVDFAAVAKACSYPHATTTHSLDEFANTFAEFNQGPMLLVVKSFPYSRPDLGRPTTTPYENKHALMKHLGVPV